MAASARRNGISAIVYLVHLTGRFWKGRSWDELVRLAIERGDTDAIMTLVVMWTRWKRSDFEWSDDLFRQAATGTLKLLFFCMCHALKKGRMCVEKLLSVYRRLGPSSTHECLPEIADMIATGDKEAIELQRQLTAFETSPEQAFDIVQAFVTTHKSRSLEWTFWADYAANRVDIRVARQAAEAGVPFAQCYLALRMLETGGKAAGLAMIERLVATAPHLALMACRGIASRGFRVPRNILVIGAEARVPICLVMLSKEVRERNPERARRLTLRAEAAGVTWHDIMKIPGSKPDGRTLARLARSGHFQEGAAGYLASAAGGLPVTRIARWCYRLIKMVRDSKK
jgi:hypothetical protein